MYAAQDVCLPILDDVLGRPLFSASVRLPSPVVNSPGAMMLPFDKLLQNVTGSLYAVQPANHVVPAVPYLTPVSQRIYGFSCPMGSFLICECDMCEDGEADNDIVFMCTIHTEHLVFIQFCQIKV